MLTIAVKKLHHTQLAHNILRTSPNGPIVVEMSQTIIGPK